jgi:hypothetical protein
LTTSKKQLATSNNRKMPHKIIINYKTWEREREREREMLGSRILP